MKKIPPVMTCPELEEIYKKTRHEVADNIYQFFGDKLTLEAIVQIKEIVRREVRNGLLDAYELGKKDFN